MNPMSTAPKDGTRILLHYKIHTWNWTDGDQLHGTKWEECLWVDAMGRTCWTEWCGNDKRSSSMSIKEEHCIGWIELPTVEA